MDGSNSLTGMWLSAVAFGSRWIGRVAHRSSRSQLGNHELQIHLSREGTNNGGACRFQGHKMLKDPEMWLTEAYRSTRTRA
jgi:hypothetical protein